MKLSHIKSAFLLSATILAFQSGAAFACDSNCEDKIDELSNEARNSNQSVAQGRNKSVVVKYGAGIPVLKCRPLNFCSIQLQPGETPVEEIALGDNVLWDAQVRVSKSTTNPQVRIVIKPDESATQTSLLVATDKRFYDVQLIKSDTEYTQVLAFTYPAEIEAANKAKIAALAKAKARKNSQRKAARAKKSIPVNKKSVHVSKLNFNYSIGGKAPFKPTRVFHDGRKTYIDLPEGYLGEKPVFLAGNSSKTNEIVNSRWNGKRLTIDRVISSGTLVRGVGGRAQKISIKKAN